MQTSKARNGLSEAPQKTSPRTPKSTRSTKSGGSDPDSSSSKHTPTKSQTDKSIKVAERWSPRSPATEKRRPSKLADLEAQLSQVQDDLKKTKDELASSESEKKQAQLEAEDIKKQLEVMTAKLEDSQNQLMEFSAAEESRLQELRAISQDHDRAWQSELEAVQKQHSVDSAALASAMNEIHRLKFQLEAESEKAEIELQNLKQDMEKLKVKLDNSERAEVEAGAKVVEAQQNLEVAKATVETLRVEGSKILELFKESISELEESKARVVSLEETVNKLQNDLLNAGDYLPLGSLESEVHQLRSALQAAEKKYEEQARITSHVQSAYEVTEQLKCESQARQSELESALNNAKSELCELKANLLDKETELQAISEMNEELKANLLDKETELQAISEMNEELKAKLGNTEVKQMESKLKADLMDKENADLMDKENALQYISEENEQLKLEMSKRETDNIKLYESAIAGMELAKAKEKEALLKLEHVTEEAEAAKMVNAEMDAELRRLRVQSDQWRKAAEAAANVLTTNSGRIVERTGSMDAEYQSVAGKLMHSPFSDDLDDNSPKKKNGGVLRKFGLWKKNSK